ncbi:hypothetical protein Pcinc_041198 [Petrolisthes cinctipes]|uniref:Uncharacterized protein n=1 Tax=Petrolisthes cinctipes TaxID=88211 RepID=A0AAE1BNR2_PETCI|nr:hypothetical protein Pcinc_041198 [Petrolisthes cinctipes]
MAHTWTKRNKSLQGYIKKKKIANEEKDEKQEEREEEKEEEENEGERKEGEIGGGKGCTNLFTLVRTSYCGVGRKEEGGECLKREARDADI